MGDAVGWGFVVRGTKPCHIQAVDPSGPAAAAGMKVGGPLGGHGFRDPHVVGPTWTLDCVKRVSSMNRF